MPAYSFDRLSTQDNSFLLWETSYVHMHVSSTLVFDAGPLRTPEGGVKRPLTTVFVAGAKSEPSESGLFPERCTAGVVGEACSELFAGERGGVSSTTTGGGRANSLPCAEIAFTNFRYRKERRECTLRVAR